MGRDAATTVRLRNLISRIKSQTKSGGLHWERQVGSAHRYARLNNNLLILGPATPLSDRSVPRYLFITPFDSPDCIEINSDDAVTTNHQPIRSRSPTSCSNILRVRALVKQLRRRNTHVSRPNQIER